MQHQPFVNLNATALWAKPGRLCMAAASPFRPLPASGTTHATRPTSKTKRPLDVRFWDRSGRQTEKPDATGIKPASGGKSVGKGWFELRQESSRKLFAYWNGLRGSRPAPERSEIEPSDIRDILGDTFILEVSAQMRTISFRLAGTRLCAAHGRELKGLGFLALWDEDDNFEIAKAIAQVYRDNIPITMSYRGMTEEARFLDFEAVLLPLAPAVDGNARILGVAAPRKTPYWLGAEPIVVNHLRHLRPIDAEIDTEVDAPPMQAGTDFAEIPGQNEGPRRVAHLTVLDGGRN